MSEKLNEVERPRFGADVSIRNYWIRHAQKTSAAIGNKDSSGLSTASITPKGEGDAHDFGAEIEAQTDGVKAYVSSSERTTQTVENILDGYQQSNKDAHVRQSIRIRNELTSSFPPGFLELYDKKFIASRAKILEEKGIPASEFSKLSPDEQEKIAELAEEPVISEWLSDKDSELGKIYPPEEAAAKFTKLFQRRHERLASKLYSDSEIDLLHVTHKTITEPFLVSGVLIRKSDNQRITKIEELGGSLETLGNWESSIITDSMGNPTVNINVRDEDYKIDSIRFSELLKYGKEKTNS